MCMKPSKIASWKIYGSELQGCYMFHRSIASLAATWGSSHGLPAFQAWPLVLNFCNVTFQGAQFGPFLEPLWLQEFDIHFPKTNSSHLKMDDWNTIVSFWGVYAYFQGLLLLVSGRVLLSQNCHCGINKRTLLAFPSRLRLRSATHGLHDDPMLTNPWSPDPIHRFSGRFPWSVWWAAWTRMWTSEKWTDVGRTSCMV